MHLIAIGRYSRRDKWACLSAGSRFSSISLGGHQAVLHGRHDEQGEKGRPSKGSGKRQRPKGSHVAGAPLRQEKHDGECDRFFYFCSLFVDTTVRLGAGSHGSRRRRPSVSGTRLFFSGCPRGRSYPADPSPAAASLSLPFLLGVFALSAGPSACYASPGSSVLHSRSALRWRIDAAGPTRGGPASTPWNGRGRLDHRRSSPPPPDDNGHKIDEKRKPNSLIIFFSRGGRAVCCALPFCFFFKESMTPQPTCVLPTFRCGPPLFFFLHAQRIPAMPARARPSGEWDQDAG